MENDGLDVRIEETWKNVNNVFKEVGESVMGYRNRQNEEWMSVEIWAKVSERKELKQKYDNIQPLENILNQIKKRVKRGKRRWVDELAKEAEYAAQVGNSRQLYSNT